MQKEHEDAIQKNFTSLVEQTDLDLMVSALYEKEVFSGPMIEPYKDTNKDVRSRKRQLYRDITRRGPDAFGHLLDALSENGYWDLVRYLDPNSALHTANTRPNQYQTGENSFLSLSGIRRKTATGKEQNDPNRNWADQSTSHGSGHSSGRTMKAEKNGNPMAEHTRPGETADKGPYIPHFNVTKSTKFFENDGKDIKLYVTRGRRRGVLVLFSYWAYCAGIDTFRHGAERDATNLRYLFDELGFKTLNYQNLSLEDTKAALSSLKDGICGEGPESVFVVFASHGYQRAGSGDNDIRCSDGSLISYYDILHYFTNQHFPALLGVPKVFIFQTCRGVNTEYSVRAPPHMRAPVRSARAIRPSVTDGGVPYTDSDAPHADSDAPHADSDTPHADSDAPHADGSVPYTDDKPADPAGGTADTMYSDILIAHSTVPGYVSRRDPELGSWYIQVLCAVFAERAHDTHVDDLLTLTDKRLRKTFLTQTSSVDRWGFNKRLYLHPGLYE